MTSALVGFGLVIAGMVVLGAVLALASRFWPVLLAGGMVAALLGGCAYLGSLALDGAEAAPPWWAAVLFFGGIVAAVLGAVGVSFEPEPGEGEWW